MAAYGESSTQQLYELRRLTTVCSSCRLCRARRFPQFDLVSLWIDYPGKFPVLGFVNLFEHFAAFFLQRLDQVAKVVNSVVDHKGRRARSEMIAFLWIDQPGSRACNRLSIAVGPIEGSPAPGFDIDSQVSLVPRPQ